MAALATMASHDAAGEGPAEGARRISLSIGKPLKRLDTPDKVNGKVVYGIDAMLPGMKFAAIAICPVFGGKVGKVDDSAASKSRACGRSSCWTIWSRWSATTCGRRRRASTRST